MSLSDLILDIESSVFQLQGKLALLHVYDEMEKEKEKELKERIPELTELDILFTRKEAAAFIGKSVRQLERICSQYKIVRENVAGYVRIRKSELLRFKGYDIPHPSAPDTMSLAKPGTLEELRKQIIGK